MAVCKRQLLTLLYIPGCKECDARQHVAFDCHQYGFEVSAVTTASTATGETAVGARWAGHLVYEEFEKKAVVNPPDQEQPACISVWMAAVLVLPIRLTAPG
jgi:hypothetical protein